MTERTIDHSRYRMAATIVDRFEAGEGVPLIAQECGLKPYVVELIVAAADRKGRYEKR